MNLQRRQLEINPSGTERCQIAEIGNHRKEKDETSSVPSDSQIEMISYQNRASNQITGVFASIKDLRGSLSER